MQSALRRYHTGTCTTANSAAIRLLCRDFNTSSWRANAEASEALAVRLFRPLEAAVYGHVNEVVHG